MDFSREGLSEKSDGSEKEHVTMEKKNVMRKELSTEKDMSMEKDVSMDKGSFMEKIQRLALRGIAVMGLLIFLFLTLYSWLYTVKVITDTEALIIEKDSLGMSLLGMMLFMLFAEGIQIGRAHV